MKKILSVLTIICIISACIDEDLLETTDIANTQLNPGYSIPIGHFTYDMNTYLDSLTDVPDTGTFIDTIIYLEEEVPFLDSVYHFKDSVELRLAETNTNNQYIDSITILVRLQNFYPTEITYQGYFRTENRVIIDSVFQEGPQPIGASSITADSPEPIDPSSRLFVIGVTDHVISQVDHIADLWINGSIRLHTEDTMQLNIDSSFHYIESDLSARISLRYHTEDINP